MVHRCLVLCVVWIMSFLLMLHGSKSLLLLLPRRCIRRAVLIGPTCFLRTQGRHPHASQQHRHGMSSRSLSTAESPSTTTDSIIYQELQHLSNEIRRHDDLYYNGQIPELTDDEYDALVQHEAQLCVSYPALLEQWQNESGLGIEATRYGGRVGTSSIAPTAPTDTAVAAAAAKQKRTHRVPMLSLDNVMSVPQLVQWLERIRNKMEALNNTHLTIRTEPKLDGLSVSLLYEKANDNDNTSTLQWAATRGNGKVGHDVTPAVRHLVPSSLDLGSHEKWSSLEVRGEVILPRTAFLDHAMTASFANARNAAAGIVLRKENDPSNQELRSKLRFYAYDVVVVVDDDNNRTEDWNAIEFLKSQGFAVPEPSVTTTLTMTAHETAPWTEPDIAAMLDYYNNLQSYRETGTSSSLDWGDYDMDGCVHKIVEPSIRTVLGSSNRAPRWAVAHKFPAQSAVTAFVGLDVNVGRTGVLTPVAILEPIELGGVVVQRATLHNFPHLQQVLGARSIPKGSKILVRRAGDVIPQVVSRLDNEPPQQLSSDSHEMIDLEAPSHCPACGSATVFDAMPNNNNNNDADTGKALRCSGPPLTCPPRAVLALQHAYSRDALDLAGLSEAKIRQLMEANFIKTYGDIFRLSRDTEMLSKVAELNGWGPKSTQNLATVANRVASEGVSLGRFVYALGIRAVGKHMSDQVTDVYRTAEAFLGDLKTASASDQSFPVLRQESEATKGIGPALLSALTEFASNEQLLLAAVDLADVIRVIDSPVRSFTAANRTLSTNDAADATSKPLLGLSVVFTGTIPSLSRSAAQNLAKRMGAASTPAKISRSTDLVVVGTKGGKKVDEANKLEVKVITAQEFMIMARTVDQDS